MLLSHKPRAKKAEGPKYLSSPLGRPQNEHDSISIPSWAAREVSKGREGGRSAYCMQSFSFPHSHNMLDAVHALHANAVGPWSCRSSTAAARNITRLTGLCDDRARNVSAGKEEGTYPLNINGWRRWELMSSAGE